MEQWMVIKSAPSYDISDHGRVRSRRVRAEGKLMTPCPVPGGAGHLGVTLMEPKQRRVSVHVLVLVAFVGPRPDGLVCCHGDGNPANNHVSNLRWGTLSDNAQDSIRHGTAVCLRQYGEEAPASKLTSAQVAEIKASEGVYQRVLAEQYGVTQGTISVIRSGKSRSRG